MPSKQIKAPPKPKSAPPRGPYKKKEPPNPNLLQEATMTSTDLKTGLTQAQRRLLLSKKYRILSGKFYKIKNRQEQIVPFKRNAAQKDFEKNRHTFNIILKSRRLGFSTNEDIALFDEVLWKPIDGLIIADTEDNAKKLLQDKVMTAWENYPLKQLYSVERNSSDSLRFGWGRKNPNDPQQYSSITVAVSGRSAGYAWVHISEFGKICAKFPEKAREIISGTIPTIPIGGRLTIESTAEGAQGYFHDIFWDAYNKPPGYQYGPTEYKAHFYNWQWDKEEIEKVQPGQREDLPPFFVDYQKEHNLTDQEIWYYVAKWKSLAKDFNLLKQEYPTTPQEAFESAGDPMFSHEAINEQYTNYQHPPIRVHNNVWQIYEEPVPNHRYAMAGDPSEGVGKDNAAAVIIDFTPTIPRVVATFKDNNTSADDLGHIMVEMGKLYNYAYLCPLLNNQGHLTTYIIKKNYLEYLIYKQVDEKGVVDKLRDKLGFTENMSTKATMVGEMKTAILERAIIIPSSELLTELKTYQKDNLQQIRSEREKNGHWDLATALFACYQMRKYMPMTSTVTTYFAPKTATGYNKDGKFPEKQKATEPHSAI